MEPRVQILLAAIDVIVHQAIREAYARQVNNNGAFKPIGYFVY